MAAIFDALIAARAAASNAKGHTAEAAARQVRALAAALPPNASDCMRAAFFGRVEAAGVTVTPGEIAAALTWAAEFDALMTTPTQPAPQPLPPELPAPPGVEPAPPPAPVVEPVAAGKYRYGQPQLFQPVPSKWTPARLPGQPAPFLLDIFGPTHLYVDTLTGWPWDRPGGDWLDFEGTRHGPVPWARVTTDPQGATPSPRWYDLDVTALVHHCQEHKRWLAMLLQCGAGRTFAAAASATPPHMVVAYADGTSETLPLWCMAQVSQSSQGPGTQEGETGVPLFVEFKRPEKPISSAKLRIYCTMHWSGQDRDLRAYLLDPPVNKDAEAWGVAAQAGLLDDGLHLQPGVQGVHRYVDGSSIGDFVHPGALNYNNEETFDPAIFGRGPTDVNRLPHLGLGKWINTNDSWSLVRSDYSGEGFAPLAPGVGAMRLQMPADPSAVDGGVNGYSGTTATTAMIFLPEPVFGRQRRIFVRYYMRLGTPYARKPSDRKQVFQAVGSPATWSTMAGKFGIGASHATSWGGVSGTSGGPYGWQMRGSWYDCDAGMNGPDEGGIAAGYHLFDYYYRNPKGYNYGGPDGTPEQERWGQRGGLGGMLYAGHWYCIETELDLNTISDAAPGFVPDGALRTWIDGRLAYDRAGMVFRSGPVLQAAPVSNGRRPVRDLGVIGLWLDWFHGGKTLNSVDRTTFFTGLAYGTEYIGPMKGPGGLSAGRS